MPLRYHDDNAENIYSINRIGGGFSDAAIRLQQLRMLQQDRQNQLQQQAFQNALEQRRLGMEEPYYAAGTAERNQNVKDAQAIQANAGVVNRLRGAVSSPLLGQVMADPSMGPQIIGDLRAANVAPSGAFNSNEAQMRQLISAALGSYLARSASTSPAVAQRMQEPRLETPNTISRDPFTGEQQYQNPPAQTSDAQRIRQQGIDLHNKSMEGMRREELDDQKAYRKTLLDIQRYKLAIDKYGVFHPELYKNDNEGEDFGASTTKAPTGQPLTATNPSTGQKVQSLDGGNTWVPLNDSQTSIKPKQKQVQASPVNPTISAPPTLPSNATPSLEGIKRILSTPTHQATDLEAFQVLMKNQGINRYNDPSLTDRVKSLLPYAKYLPYGNFIP